MKLFRCPILVLALLTASISDHADESDLDLLSDPPTGWNWSPAIGVSLSDPTELNSFLASKTLGGQSMASAITWAAAVSVSADYPVNPYVRAGLRLEYANIDESQTLTVDNASGGIASKLSWLIPYATLEAAIPVTSGFSAGLASGAGVPVFYRLELDESLSQNGSNRSGSATYDAHPFSAYVAAVALLRISDHTLLRAEAGYRWLNASAVTASGAGSGSMSSVSDGALLTDGASAVPIDASAPYAQIGLTFNL